MKDEDMTKEQLINELVELRQRITELQISETPRKQAEDALRKSELQYRSTLDSMGDIIHVIDTDLRFTLFNNAFKQINKELGFDADVMGRKISDAFPFLSDSILNDYNQVFETGKTLFTEENTIIRGREFVTETIKIPIFEEDKVTYIVTVIRDVTKRKRMEDAVRKSEKRFRELAELLPETVFEIDLKGNLRFANRIAFDVFGYSQEDFDRGINAFQAIIPEDQERLNENISRVFSGEDTGINEYVALKKDGSRLPVIIRSNVIRDDDENPVGIRGIIIDITERKQAEEKIREYTERLEESEKRYRGLYDSSIDGIVSRDLEGYIIECNQAFANMLGYTKEKVYQMSPEKLIPSKLFDSLNTLIEEQVRPRGYSNELEVEYIKKDGTVLPASVRVWSIKDKNGNLTGTWAIVRDITERKRMEKQLIESEEKYRTLVEKDPNMIYLIKDGKVAFANQALLDTVGYSMEELYNLDLDLLLPIVPKQRQMIRERLKKRIAGEQVPESYEFSVMTKSGEIIPCLLNTTSFEMEGIRVVQGVLTDIRKIKALEKELKESEERYRGLYESSIDGIASVDMDGNITDCNQSLAEILGYSKEELYQSKFHEHIPSKWLVTTAQILKEQIIPRGYSDEYEIEAIKKDGTIIPVSARSWLIKDKDGNMTGTWAIIRDISERKQAEKIIRESEERYRTLFEDSKDAICSTSREGTLIDANQAMEEIFGYTREELIGMNILEAYVNPEDRGRFQQEIERKGSIRDFGVKLCKKDNTVIDCLFTATVRRDDNGKILGYHGFIRDITEQKSAEKEIKARVRQQAAVAKLSQQALAGKDLSTLMDEAVALISQSVDVEYSKVLELLPDDNALLLRAGVGWKEGYVGHATVKASLNSQAGYTLQSSGPVIVDDLRKETRFNGPPLLFVHGVISGMSVIIGGRDRPFGVLGAHTIKRRKFTEDDITFLQSIANVLATAIERKRTEDALKASEERYRGLYDSSIDGIVSVDMGGKITDCNQSFVDMLGYASEELYNLTFWNLIPRKWYDLLDKITVEQTIPRGHSDEFETEAIKKDGTIISISVRSWFIKDNEGNPTGTWSIVRDITERKKIEENMKKMKEKYESLIKNIPDVIYSALPDATSTTTFISEGIKDWIGYSPEEFYKNNELWSKCIHPEDRDKAIETFINAYTNKQEFIFEYRMVHKETGQIRYVRDHGMPIRDKEGQIIRFDGILTDITERQRTEAALREAETKYRTLVEQSLQGVLILQDGRIVFANQALSEIAGYTVEELITLSPEKVTAIVHPEDQSLVWGRMRDHLMGKSVPNRYEYRVIRKDGSIIWLEMFANLIEYRGKPAVQATFADITEKRKLEEELLKVEKLESLGILAGGIAHDFNNILTGILGNISLAKEYTSPGEKVFERLTEAEKASMRAKDLTQQLLTFSKGGAPIKKTVRCTELIKETAAFTLSGSNVRCEFSLPKDLWSVVIDEGQISQVINNIVINADQAMPEGGIIKISAENTTVSSEEALSLQEGNYIKIAIQDQGIGIPKDHLNKIFDPYFTTKHKGSGLGLAVAYSIIKNHEGHLGVESELGVGSTFTIYLPASQEQPTSEKEAEKRVITGRGKILVMDDEEVIREAIGEILTHLGYQVEFARNGEEAITLYKNAKDSGQLFNAVIMDLTVPGGMGGKETIQKLIEIAPDVKAIVSSGYSTDPVMSDFETYGFSGVVAKPYNIRELSETLYRIINKD